MAAEGGRAPLLPAEARPCAPRRPRAPAPPGGRCHRAWVGASLGCLAGCCALLGRYHVFFLYARGAQWDYFVWCQLHLLVLQCPPLQLSVPERGCPVGGGPRKRLLLTADGLASPRSQSVFQEFVKEGRDDWGKKSGLVMYVMDAVYVSHDQGVPGFGRSPEEYCQLRTGELSALGASEVYCVLLDSAARERERASQGQGNGSFVKVIRNMTDDAIYRKLQGAAAVFVEGGNAFFLMAAFRRKLDLKRFASSSTSFGDALRDRVRNASRMLAYVGVSAGSIVAGADVSLAMPATFADRLDGDWSGLSLVPGCSFLPHATGFDSEFISAFSASQHSGVMGIPQCQPVVETQSASLQYVCPS